MKFLYTLMSLVWLVLAILAWIKQDTEGTRYSFIMFWFMVVLNDLDQIKRKSNI